MNTPEHHIDPELLSAYLDEEVSADERQLIETHLPTCAACQQELATLRFTMALVQALPPRSIPRTFYVTEEMVAPQPKSQPAGWWGWLRGLAPFGAAIAALLMILVVARPLMVGTGGAAVPAAAPAMSEAEIAVAMTEAPMESASAPQTTQGDAATRNGEVPADGMVADEQTTMEPPMTVAEGTAVPEEAAEPTYSFSITSPIVSSGETAGGDNATDTVTGVAPTSPDSVETLDKDTSVTPITMNTTLIITAIVVVVVVGVLVIMLRRRSP